MSWRVQQRSYILVNAVERVNSRANNELVWNRALAELATDHSSLTMTRVLTVRDFTDVSVSVSISLCWHRPNP